MKPRFRRGVCRLPLVALGALFVAAAHCQTVQPPPVATSVPQSAADLSARLTAVMPTALPGWTVTAAPQICDRTCLAQGLPQDAELTLTYKFQWSLALRLMPPDPHQEIEARVFCMAEDLDAFGMFAHYRTEQTTTSPLATQSFWAGNVLHLWRGTFYLRLIPASSDKLLRASVMAAGEAIAAQIPIPAQLPPMMHLMPSARALPNTLRYYRQSVLGNATLGDGLVDTYLEDGSKLTLTLLRATDEPAATALYGTVVNLVAGGALTTTIPDLGKAAATVTSAQFGLCYVMREGSYVVLATGVHDRPTAEGLLRITGTDIRISRF